MSLLGKEQRETLTATIDRIERECRELNNSTLVIEVCGTNVKFDTKITFDQVDKKVIRELIGANGCYCTFCKISKEDASCPIRIRKGFNVEKTMSEIIENAQKLDAEGKLNSKTSSAERGGQTKLAACTDYFEVNQILPPLHAKINLLTNVLKLLYLFCAREYFANKWPLCDERARKRDQDQKDFCDIVEKKFQSDAKEQPLNLKLGQHIIGSGGTSNTGTVYTLGQ